MPCADPADAAALVALAEAVGVGAGGLADLGQPLALASPTSAATCARCAGTRTRRSSSPRLRAAIVGRLSIARDPHPASRHVADLGLMVAADAAPPRRSAGRCSTQAVEWAREAGVRSSSCTSSRTTSRRSRLYESVRLRPGGLPQEPLPPRPTSYVDAILMAYESLEASGVTLPLPGRALAHLALARQRLRRASRAARPAAGAAARSERSSSSSCFSSCAEVDARRRAGTTSVGEPASGSSTSSASATSTSCRKTRAPARPPRRSAARPRPRAARPRRCGTSGPSVSSTSRNARAPRRATFIRPSSKLWITSSTAVRVPISREPVARSRGSARTRCRSSRHSPISSL